MHAMASVPAKTAHRNQCSYAELILTQISLFVMFAGVFWVFCQSFLEMSPLDTPDFTPDHLQINTNPRNGKPAFNTALLSLPALGQIGTARRRFVYGYGPGFDNFGIAIQKNVPSREAKSLEFRIATFNVFNHAQFYGPAAVNGDTNSTKFGQIVSAAPPRLVQLVVRFLF